MRTGDCEYRGILASTYDLLLPEDLGDLEFFRAAIRGGGEPALEIGCGTGRLLLRYRADGLDVEGADSSDEMLAICRGKAEERGVTATLHRRLMETLDLPRRYRLIYVPTATFQFLPASEAREALERFHRHLVPGGRVMLSLFLPWKTDFAAEPAPPDQWRLRREGVRPEDGATIRCWERSVCDFEARVKSVRLRYEVLRGGEVESAEERSMAVYWYEQREIAGLLRAAGFHEVQALRGHTEEAATAEDGSFTMVGKRLLQSP